MPTVLPVAQSLSLLHQYKIPTCEFYVCREPFELSEVPFKFPWAMKLSSDRIVHKTEQKAVYTNIQNRTDANTTFSELQKRDPRAPILVQPHLDGTELFIGSNQDIQFGPTILVGLGGVFVELLKDTSIRVLPVSIDDCRQMIRDLKHQAVLAGFRGKPKVDTDQLAKILLQTSKMIQENKFLELDINPLIATKKGIYAVDARIVK